MPWQQKLKKDVTNYEMSRGAVSTLRSGNIRMWEHMQSNIYISQSEYIALERATQGTETSKYLEEKKEKSITLVVASEKVEAQTRLRSGVVGHLIRSYKIALQQNNLERLTKEGESPVHEMKQSLKCILSTAGHEESCRNQRGPSRKAKYSLLTDSEQVP